MKAFLTLEAGPYRLFRPLPWAAVTVAAAAVVLVPVPGWIAFLCNAALALLVAAGWFLVALWLPEAEAHGGRERATIGDQVRR